MRKEFKTYEEANAFINVMKLHYYRCYEETDDYATTYIVIEY